MGTISAPAHHWRVSTLAWPRLRRLAVTFALFIAAIGAWQYLSPTGLVLSADGLVMREYASVSAPFDARIKHVFVQPGDQVQKGQEIAVVESASISRTLAELASERARVGSRVAQLESRRSALEQLLPVAESNAKQAKGFQDELTAAASKGLTVSRTLNEIATAHFTATERLLSLKAERDSLQAELQANLAALGKVDAAYAQLQQIYEDGIIRASVTGYIGHTVAHEGEVLVPGKDQLSRIHFGRSYVLAFTPEAYLFDIEIGQSVAVKARGKATTGTVQKILPVTDALPPEFQIPGKARNRGQVVVIALKDASQFAVEEKVHVTGCVINCNAGLTSVVRVIFQSAPSKTAEQLEGGRPASML